MKQAVHVCLDHGRAALLGLTRAERASFYFTGNGIYLKISSNATKIQHNFVLATFVNNLNYAIVGAVYAPFMIFLLTIKFLNAPRVLH